MLSLACTPADDSGKLTDTADSGGGDTDTNDTDDTGDYGGATLQGVVLDPTGAPLPDFRVNVCRSLCMTTRTGADGSYTMSGIAAEVASYYIQGDDTLGLAVPFAPITWIEGDTHSIDIRLVETGPSENLDGSGSYGNEELGVQFGNGDLVDYLTGDPISTLAVTAAPADARPPLELSGEVLAVYYLAPFEAHGEATVTLREAWGLAPGETVDVWYGATPLESAFVQAGTLTVEAAGEWMTGTATIHALTVVVVTRGA